MHTYVNLLEIQKDSSSQTLIITQTSFSTNANQEKERDPKKQGVNLLRKYKPDCMAGEGARDMDAP
jgi:hypothetical protein